MRDLLAVLVPLLQAFFALCWLVAGVAVAFYATPPEWAVWGVLASLPFWLLNKWLPGDWHP